MRYSELKSNAEREAMTRFPRALVQLGGCTRTVGAGAVLSLLQATVAKKGLMTPVLVSGVRRRVPRGPGGHRGDG